MPELTTLRELHDKLKLTINSGKHWVIITDMKDGGKVLHHIHRHLFFASLPLKNLLGVDLNRTIVYFGQTDFQLIKDEQQSQRRTITFITVPMSWFTYDEIIALIGHCRVSDMEVSTATRKNDTTNTTEELGVLLLEKPRDNSHVLEQFLEAIDHDGFGEGHVEVADWGDDTPMPNQSNPTMTAMDELRRVFDGEGGKVGIA